MSSLLMNLCKTLEGIKTLYVSQLIRYAESRQLQATVVPEVSTIAFEGSISQILWLISQMLLACFKTNVKLFLNTNFDY